MTLDPGGTIFAVASGKGGVGKTWLSVTLAHAMARPGRRVLLFDGDLGLANVDVQLGLMPDSDLSAVVAGRVRLDQAIMRHQAGFDILACRSGSGSLAALDPAALEAMLAALRIASAAYDAVVIDLGAGIDRATRRMAVFADTLLVVATDEPTSLTDAYAVLKLHARDAGAGKSDVRVVVNQAASHAAGRRSFDALANACGKFLGNTPPLAGIIRRDPRVPQTIRHQSLLLVRHPTTEAAADVEALARLLGGVGVALP